MCFYEPLFQTIAEQTPVQFISQIGHQQGKTVLPASIGQRHLKFLNASSYVGDDEPAHRINNKDKNINKEKTQKKQQ